MTRALIGGLVLALTPSACRGPELAPERGLALESCRLDGLSTAALCGTLEVPEDPENASSRQIPLRVAVLEARGRAPEGDPVWFLAGGPGQGATEAFPPVLAAYDELMRARDVVLVDIRGTGSSTALDCDFGETLADKLRSEFDPEELKRCLADLPGDPVHHTTRNAVEDLEAVRVALGYDKINLISGSYGTRLALEFARHHGDRVRTLVLDGVAPPQMAMPEGFAVDAQSAFDAMARDCAADPACASAFPDVPGDLDRVLSRLGSETRPVSLEHPRTGEILEVEVDRAMVVGGLRGILYSPELSSLLPLVIHQAAEGDLGPLLGQAVVFSDSVSDTMSIGLMLSMLCAEDLPRTRPDEQRRQDGSTFLGSTVYDFMLDACEHWPHAPLPATAGRPVVADVPALLLSGAVDPVTPPRWAELASESLSRSTHVVLPNTGHGTLTRRCVPDLVTEFIASADPTGVDGACVEDVQRPSFFIDFAGPSH